MAKYLLIFIAIVILIIIVVLVILINKRIVPDPYIILPNPIFQQEAANVMFSTSSNIIKTNISTTVLNKKVINLNGNIYWFIAVTGSQYTDEFGTIENFQGIFYFLLTDENSLTYSTCEYQEESPYFPIDTNSQRFISTPMLPSDLNFLQIGTNFVVVGYNGYTNPILFNIATSSYEFIATIVTLPPLLSTRLNNIQQSVGVYAILHVSGGDVLYSQFSINTFTPTPISSTINIASDEANILNYLTFNDNFLALYYNTGIFKLFNHFLAFKDINLINDYDLSSYQIDFVFNLYVISGFSSQKNTNDILLIIYKTVSGNLFIGKFQFFETTVKLLKKTKITQITLTSNDKARTKQIINKITDQIFFGLYFELETSTNNVFLVFNEDLEIVSTKKYKANGLIFSLTNPVRCDKYFYSTQSNGGLNIQTTNCRFNFFTRFAQRLFSFRGRKIQPPYPLLPTATNLIDPITEELCTESFLSLSNNSIISYIQTHNPFYTINTVCSGSQDPVKYVQQTATFYSVNAWESASPAIVNEGTSSAVITPVYFNDINDPCPEGNTDAEKLAHEYLYRSCVYELSELSSELVQKNTINAYRTYTYGSSWFRNKKIPYTNVTPCLALNITKSTTVNEQGQEVIIENFPTAVTNPTAINSYQFNVQDPLITDKQICVGRASPVTKACLIRNVGLTLAGINSDGGDKYISTRFLIGLDVGSEQYYTRENPVYGYEAGFKWQTSESKKNQFNVSLEAINYSDGRRGNSKTISSKATVVSAENLNKFQGQIRWSIQGFCQIVIRPTSEKSTTAFIPFVFPQCIYSYIVDGVDSFIAGVNLRSQYTFEIFNDNNNGFYYQTNLVSTQNRHIPPYSNSTEDIYHVSYTSYIEKEASSVYMLGFPQLRPGASGVQTPTPCIASDSEYTDEFHYYIFPEMDEYNIQDMAYLDHTNYRGNIKQLAVPNGEFTIVKKEGDTFWAVLCVPGLPCRIFFYKFTLPTNEESKISPLHRVTQIFSQHINNLPSNFITAVSENASKKMTYVSIPRLGSFHELMIDGILYYQFYIHVLNNRQTYNQTIQDTAEEQAFSKYKKFRILYPIN